MIANRTNRKQPYAFDARRYRRRNGIERMFDRLEDFRRIAARYDKKAENVMAALCLAAIRSNGNGPGPKPSGQKPQNQQRKSAKQNFESKNNPPAIFDRFLIIRENDFSPLFERVSALCRLSRIPRPGFFGSLHSRA